MPTKTKPQIAETDPFAPPTITIATANLRLAIEPAARVASSAKGAMILQQVFLSVTESELKATGTDGQFWLSQTVNCESSTPIGVCIAAKDIRNIVKALPGEKTTIEIDSKKLTLRSGSAKIDLPIMAADDYPLPEFPKDEITTLTYVMGDFRNAVNRVKHARLKKDVEVKPACGGVNFRVISGEGITDDALYLECCDSVQAARCRLMGDIPSFAITVPFEWIDEICDFPLEDPSELTLQVSPQGFFGCDSNGRSIAGRQVLGQFPPTNKFFPIPDDIFESIVFDVETLSDAINLAALPSRSDPMYVGYVTMTKGPDTLGDPEIRLSSSDQCQSKGESSCAYQGELLGSFAVRFDERIVAQILSACPSATVKFSTSKRRAMVFEEVSLAPTWIALCQEKAQ